MSEISNIDFELFEKTQKHHDAKSKYSMESEKEKSVSGSTGDILNPKMKSFVKIRSKSKKAGGFQDQQTMLFDLLQLENMDCEDEQEFLGKLVGKIGRLKNFEIEKSPVSRFAPANIQGGFGNFVQNVEENNISDDESDSDDLVQEFDQIEKLSCSIGLEGQIRRLNQNPSKKLSLKESIAASSCQTD